MVFFKKPPNVDAAGEGQINIPLWWPIIFLQKISPQAPEQVVEIILGLDKTDNPRIMREVFSIACDLTDVGLSLRLKPWIMRFLQSSYRWGEDELIVKIIQKWGRYSEQALTAALEITQYVVAFQPDPKEEEKRSCHKGNPEAWNTNLDPAPRFDQWAYQQILEKGVRPLAANEPDKVVGILIKATNKMILMRVHTDDLDNVRDEDYSEIWCQRLDKLDREHQDVEETLIHALTFACEQVFEKASESIDELNQALRSQRWKLFKRLRHYLYGMYPNDQTLPWIRECILGHKDYSKWEYHYEFQLMIRKASEHFGTRLLSNAELTAIFDDIISGPSKEEFRKWMGERYNDDAFQQRSAISTACNCDLLQHC